MDNAFDLGTVDVDGAIREAAEHVDGDTRAAFLRKAAVFGGGAVGGAVAFGAMPGEALARGGRKRRALKVLEFALTLEYLESRFYKEAVRKRALTGDVLAYAKLVAEHEKTHVVALRRAIRGLAPHHHVPGIPEFDFRGTTESQDAFIRTSYKLENVGVRAYLGQAGKLQHEKKLLRAAASIVTVEARHASAAAILFARNGGGGGDPFNGSTGITPHGAFDEPSSRGQILHAVKRTHFIKG